MVECGSMSEPPSTSNITIWGIVTFVIMGILGILSIYGVLNALNFWSLWSILDLIASGFGVAGLVFVIISIVKHNPSYMKLGIVCFLINCVCCLVLFIVNIIRNDIKTESILSWILRLIFDIFLCVLFYLQSGGMSGVQSAASSS